MESMRSFVPQSTPQSGVKSVASDDEKILDWLSYAIKEPSNFTRAQEIWLNPKYKNVGSFRSACRQGMKMYPIL